MTKPINLVVSKEQFRELLLNNLIGIYLREAMLEADDQPFEHLRLVQKQLLQAAEEHGWKEYTQTFKNHLLPAEDILSEQHEAIDFFIDDSFWDELPRRLGQRDLDRTMTKEEESEAHKTGLVPKRTYELYQKYEEEFERYGLDRLDINEQAPNLDRFDDCEICLTMNEADSHGKEASFSELMEAFKRAKDKGAWTDGIDLDSENEDNSK